MCADILNVWKNVMLVYVNDLVIHFDFYCVEILETSAVIFADYVTGSCTRNQLFQSYLFCI